MVQIVVLQEAGEYPKILSSTPGVSMLMLQKNPPPWMELCEVGDQVLGFELAAAELPCDPTMVDFICRMAAEPTNHHTPRVEALSESY